MANEHRDDRYGSLRAILTAIKVVAWLVLILGVLTAVGAITAGQQGGQEAAQRGYQIGGIGLATGGILGGILAIVMAALWFLLLYAFADGVRLLLDIEHHTRGMRLSVAGVGERSVVGEPVRAAPASQAPASPPSRAPI